MHFCFISPHNLSVFELNCSSRCLCLSLNIRSVWDPFRGNHSHDCLSRRNRTSVSCTDCFTLTSDFPGWWASSHGWVQVMMEGFFKTGPKTEAEVIAFCRNACTNAPFTLAYFAQSDVVENLGVSPKMLSFLVLHLHLEFHFGPSMDLSFVGEHWATALDYQGGQEDVLWLDYWKWILDVQGPNKLSKQYTEEKEDGGMAKKTPNLKVIILSSAQTILPSCVCAPPWPPCLP